MHPSLVPVESFVRGSQLSDVLLVDSRSESEFTHASIPGSVNIPLLNDASRRTVGTIYKLHGKEAAVLEGFRLAGPFFHEMIKSCRTHAQGKHVYLHCWRGGMRSQIMSWLFRTAGLQVTVLKGGYKSYRNWAAAVFEKSIPLIVLGGPTGSGKTQLLHEMRTRGAQVIDLEALANHKGSAFGGIGKGSQPSQEHFENLLALAWNEHQVQQPVWIENESRSIGSCVLPKPVFDRIRNAHVIDLQMPDSWRMDNITREYGGFPAEALSQATEKLRKRMGPQHVKHALECLHQGDFNGWLAELLAYYDRQYQFGNDQRVPGTIHPLLLTQNDVTLNAERILQAAEKIPLFTNAVS